MTDLVADAADLAARLLDTEGLAHRWAHVRAVAARAGELAVTVDPADRDLLVAAAWLHDVGYAPPLVVTGFHALDGAFYLQAHGWPHRLAALVAHHSAARVEAAERGLGPRLEAFPLEAGPVMDALVAADLTTGPQGQSVDMGTRINEILHRYPPETAVHRAVSRALPILAHHVQRALSKQASVA